MPTAQSMTVRECPQDRDSQRACGSDHLSPPSRGKCRRVGDTVQRPLSCFCSGKDRERSTNMGPIPAPETAFERGVWAGARRNRKAGRVSVVSESKQMDEVQFHFFQKRATPTRMAVERRVPWGVGGGRATHQAALGMTSVPAFSTSARRCGGTPRGQSGYEGVCRFTGSRSLGPPDESVPCLQQPFDRRPVPDRVQAVLPHDRPAQPAPALGVGPVRARRGGVFARRGIGPAAQPAAGPVGPAVRRASARLGLVPGDAWHRWVTVHAGRGVGRGAVHWAHWVMVPDGKRSALVVRTSLRALGPTKSLPKRPNGGGGINPQRVRHTRRVAASCRIHRPPPAAFTSASTPARIAGGRSGHAATIAANSGSVGLTGGVAGPKPAPMLPDLLPSDSETGVFPAGFAGCSSPALPTCLVSTGSHRTPTPTKSSGFWGFFVFESDAMRSLGRACVAGFAAASLDAVARVQSASVTCR